MVADLTMADVSPSAAPQMPHHPCVLWSHQHTWPVHGSAAPRCPAGAGKVAENSGSSTILWKGAKALGAALLGWVAMRWLTYQRGKWFWPTHSHLPSYGSEMEPCMMWGWC